MEDNAVVDGNASGGTDDAPDVRLVAPEVLPAGVVSKAERSLKPTMPPEMAVLVARYGEDGLMDEIADDILEGCDYGVVASRFGLRKGALVRWLLEDEDRERVYRGVLRLKADLMAHEVLRIADEGDAEDVAHRKLRVDTRFRVMSKWDARVYGEGKGVTIGVGVNVSISSDDAGVL